MSFRAALKSYADSSPSFLVATCCQTHSQVYAESFQKIAPCNRLPTFLFWIDDAVIFLGRVFLLVFFWFCFLFSSLPVWLAFVAFVAFGLLASDVGFRILAFVGFCWLFAFVGFCWLLDVVSLRFWLLAWLFALWLQLAFAFLASLGLSTWYAVLLKLYIYMYFCSLHIYLA